MRPHKTGSNEERRAIFAQPLLCSLKALNSFISDTAIGEKLGRSLLESLARLRHALQQLHCFARSWAAEVAPREAEGGAAAAEPELKEYLAEEGAADADAAEGRARLAAALQRLAMRVRELACAAFLFGWILTVGVVSR